MTAWADVLAIAGAVVVTGLAVLAILLAGLGRASKESDRSVREAARIGELRPKPRPPASHVRLVEDGEKGPS